MNTSYYPNAQELADIALFNGANNNYSSQERFLVFYNKTFFNTLLGKNPHLKNDYEYLKNEIKMSSKKTPDVFGKIFEGKINIHDIAQQVFNVDSYYDDGLVPRINTFNTIFDHYPELLDMMHAHLNNHKNDKNSSIPYDKALMNSYYYMVAKSPDTALDRIAIMDNIDAFHTAYDPQFISKKINAYLSLPIKDMVWYEHITGRLGKYFTQNAELLNLFENAIDRFDEDVKKHHHRNSIKFPLYGTNDAFYYQFRIKANAIIQRTNIENKQASDFLYVFHRTIDNVLSQHFNASLNSYNGSPTLGYLFTNEIDRDKAKQFCILITENVSPLLSKDILHASREEAQTKIHEFIYELYEVNKLQEELRANLPVNEPTKTNRHKI